MEPDQNDLETLEEEDNDGSDQPPRKWRNAQDDDTSDNVVPSRRSIEKDILKMELF